MEKTITQGLPQKLSDDIIQLIMNQHLKPGDRLPNEMDLSKELKAGRSSIREAMKLLVSRNIVEIRQGSGTYVSSRLGVSDDPLGLVFLESNRRLANDLMEIRFLIEPSIAAMAAMNADSNDIAQIAKYCNLVEEMIHRGENHMQADIQFHHAVAMSSKNLIVPRLIPIINRTIEVFVDLTDRTLLDETIECHSDILNAITRHNPEEAKDAMYLHLVYNRRSIMRRNEEQKA